MLRENPFLLSFKNKQNVLAITKNVSAWMINDTYIYTVKHEQFENLY